MIDFSVNNFLKINPIKKSAKANYFNLPKPEFAPIKKDVFIKTNIPQKISFGSKDRISYLENNLEYLTVEERQELIDYVEGKNSINKIEIDKATKITKKILETPEINYANTADAAKLFTEALQNIKCAGIDLIGLHSIQPSNSERTPGWAEFRINDKGKPEILYNFEFKWDEENLQKTVSDENFNGYLLENNPKSLVYHLVGHFLHFKTNPEFYAKNYAKNFEKFKLDDVEYFKKLDNTEKNRIRMLIKNEVSEYSFKKEKDFPAEVFTGLMNGREFSPEIMRLYNEIGMPVPYSLKQ
ncbi:MAG: hypothetical protein PHC34_09760 [Candidatus Gastranaerophilales bacterium]|nr:hypothetical protein [Candidatus Gastranaerophilales bacterium]